MALGLNVAVVVPVYNEDEAILQRTLRSLLTQTRQPGSVHIVDDGSRSDVAFQLAERFTPAFEKVGADSRQHRRPTSTSASIPTPN
jgi:cellulose synthase/poly-beta-1,6-N-acetylglucosamine synthase-like glycosyltransferase